MVKRYIFIFAIGLILVAGCADSGKSGAPAVAPLPPGIDMHLSGGVHFIEVIDGVIVWDIKSARATYATETGFLAFEDVKATYYQEGVPTYRISGQSGSYDSQNETVSLEGRVVGHTKDGYTIKTDSMQHNLNSEEARTDDRVEIRGEGLEIDGVGMVADFKNETVHILDQARVWVLPAQVNRGTSDGLDEEGPE